MPNRGGVPAARSPTLPDSRRGPGMSPPYATDNPQEWLEHPMAKMGLHYGTQALSAGQQYMKGNVSLRI